MQSGFSYMRAFSEGFELSPAYAQCALELHFKIRTKHWLRFDLAAPGQTGYTAFASTPP